MTSPSNEIGTTTMRERRGLAERRRDPDVVRRHLGQHDALPLERGLADQALAEPERVRDALALLVGVRREQLELRLVVVGLGHEERAVLRVDQRRELVEHLARDGEQIALALQHAREPREVGLEPVLLLVDRVVSASVRIIWLTLSLSSATSPRASTVIDWVRSPWVTAVATSPIARTWRVRLPASSLTLLVRSRHTPAAPGTSAWPPSRPSTPTSRATPVTCSANVDSVSIMLLIVSTSVAISPRAVSVSLWSRSPLATAVTTVAMPRTCSVRLRAMTLTLSVSSRHVPDTPRTSAWPPSTPSRPTSRATRVTSEANESS